MGVETIRENLLGWFLLLLGIGYPGGVITFYLIRREPFWKASGGS